MAHEPEELNMEERNDLQPDEITEVNEGLSQFIGTAGEVVKKYTHCALCGANLHFTHITDFSKNLTQETARCPECGVKVRRLMHRLQ
jgi:DNA-directed RNA polymerase subunit RPC12/RpoP